MALGGLAALGAFGALAALAFAAGLVALAARGGLAAFGAGRAGDFALVFAFLEEAMARNIHTHGSAGAV